MADRDELYVCENLTGCLPAAAYERENLLATIARLRAALQAQVDDAVEESDIRYWASLVLNDSTYDGKSAI